MTDFAVEISRLDDAEREVPVAERYGAVIELLRRQLVGASEPVGLARSAGNALWRHAVDDVQGGFLDDRALYWGRLAAHRCLRELGHAECGEVLERASRGLSEEPVDGPTLLLAGFDPFHLDRDIGQSNPSGTVALALHGSVIERLTVQSAILPVRFADFDASIVERLLSERFAKGDVRLVVTVSMGRDRFDLERFPGRRRSSENPDNERRLGGGAPTAPVVPDGLEGPEFLEFGLAAESMVAAGGRWEVRDNRRVTCLGRGAFEASSLEELEEETAIEGSGGGYLSNEVAYRVLRWARGNGITVPMGHIHIPAPRGHDAAWERDIVGQIGGLLHAATGALGKSRR